MKRRVEGVAGRHGGGGGRGGMEVSFRVRRMIGKEESRAKFRDPKKTHRRVSHFFV